jgi:hypothetical protein
MVAFGPDLEGFLEEANRPGQAEKAWFLLLKVSLVVEKP